MLFIAFELKKIQILKLFGPIMQKRAVEQKNSSSISSNRDQIYNGTIKNYLCAKKKLLNFKKKLPGIRSYVIIFLVTIDR